MTANNNSLANNRRAKQLRIAGAIIFALGILGAVIVYWLGTRNADLSNDVSMLGFDRAEQRQMGQLYGKQGEFVEDFFNDLKQPGAQAILIFGISGFIAIGCFYFARLHEMDDVEPPRDSAA